MATRALTSALKTKLEGATLKPLVFLEIQLGTLTYRFWNGRGSKTWDSQTWLGSGFFLRATEADESKNDRSTGLSVTFEAVSKILTSVFLQNIQQNQIGKIYFGAEDDDGSVILDPYLIFSGYLDGMEIDANPNSSLITLHYESQNGMLDRAGNQRWADESQKLLRGDDVGFQYVQQIENWSGFWGQGKR